VLAVWLLLTCAVARAQDAPWFGTWQLDPQAPSRFVTPPYKKVTTRIEPVEEGIQVTYEMVRTRGGIERREWRGRFDGRDYPVQGVDTHLTNAYRQLDDRSYEIVLKLDGRQVAVARAEVSADRKTLTVTTTEGRSRPTTAVYRRR
jgi:hypothetical protein